MQHQSQEMPFLKKKKKKLSGKIQFGNAEFCIPFLKSHNVSLQEILQQRILFDFC